MISSDINNETAINENHRMKSVQNDKSFSNGRSMYAHENIIMYVKECLSKIHEKYLSKT